MLPYFAYLVDMDRKMKKTYEGHLISVVAVVVTITILLSSCGSPKQSGGTGESSIGTPKDHAAIVQTAVVADGTLTAQHVSAGTVTAVTESNVAARVSGVVKKVNERTGARVDEGDVVVQLDSSQLALTVESAEAALESSKVSVQKAKARYDLAKLTLGRDQSLIKKQFIPQSQLDKDSTNADSARQDYLAAQASEKNANAQLARARLNLAYTGVKAPFGGQLASVNVKAGEFVGQNSAVFLLVSPDREITFSVPPSDASVLSLGTKVSFRYEGRSYQAHISQSPSAPIKGVVPIVALTDGKELLPYGAVGNITYSLRLGKGSVIPLSSLQTTGNRDYVYILLGGKAVARNVNVVAESGTKAVVAGVAPGATLILNPPPGLLDGSTVQSAGASNE